MLNVRQQQQQQQLGPGLSEQLAATTTCSTTTTVVLQYDSGTRVVYSPIVQPQLTKVFTIDHAVAVCVHGFKQLVEGVVVELRAASSSWLLLVVGSAFVSPVVLPELTPVHDTRTVSVGVSPQSRSLK